MLELVENRDDPKTKSEAHSLITHELETFEFLISLHILYNVLFNADTVNKIMQYKNMHSDVALGHVKSLISILLQYHENAHHFLNSNCPRASR